MKTDNRKVVSLILVFTLVLSLVGVAFGASDIEGHWAEEVMAEWVQKGWAKGYPNGLMVPDRFVSRAEFISMVNRAFTFTSKVESHDFADVPQGCWYEEEVVKALAARYVDGEFLRPAENTNRQDASLMLFKALKLRVTGDISPKGRFTDSNDIPDEYLQEICTLIIRGILAGYEDNTLRLDQEITRAEAMVMISRALQVKEEIERAALLENTSPIAERIIINGADYLAVSEEGSIQVEYTATVLDQYNMPIADAGVTWSLVDDVYGVSVNAATGVVTVTDTVNATHFTLMATSASKTDVSAAKTVSFVLPCGINGFVTNALNGLPIPELNVELLFSETVLASTVTANNGEFRLAGLPPGTYTIRISGSGFITVTDEVVLVTGDHSLSYVVSPLLGEGQFRIVLTWGEVPRDLDSHLLGPTSDGDTFHVYYGNEQESVGDVTYVELDHDDTSGYGPETTTIYQQLEGTYTFYVQNYTGYPSLGASGAKVEVYNGSEKVATFLVPASFTGEDWYVFRLNGTVITPIN